jgi:hypothetical protein
MYINVLRGNIGFWGNVTNIQVCRLMLTRECKISRDDQTKTKVN